MPIVSARCPNCGAPLQVDNSKDAAICPYCGNAYIVEKAINHYNITNNIRGDVVNVYGSASDFEIKAGYLHKYIGASDEVVIPRGVKVIGQKAFSGLMISSVIIPNTVTIIEDFAFMECESLKSIIIPDSVTSIGVEVFYKCSSLTNINLPDSITSIKSQTFWGCTSLQSITIPGSVTSIETNAFRDCTSLTSITIPSSVSSFGNWVFHGCSKLREIKCANKEALHSKAVAGSAYGFMHGICYCGSKAIVFGICAKCKRRIPKDF